MNTRIPNLPAIGAARGTQNALAIWNSGNDVTQRATLRDLTGTVFLADQGIASDGVTDVSAHLQDVLSGPGVDFALPEGKFRVTKPVMVPVGKRLRGVDRAKSVIYADADFDMGAAGVVVPASLTGSGPSALVEDVGVEFYQPSTSNRAELIQYPPAFRLTGGRLLLDRVRVSRAWNGIDATSCGGFFIGYAEIGAANIGMIVDEEGEFCHAQRLHFWPFGFESSGTPLGALYRDGGTTGLKTGMRTWLLVDAIASFIPKITIDRTPPSSAICIGTMVLDGARALLEFTGSVGDGSNHSPVDIGRLALNKAGSDGYGPSIRVSRGDVRIASMWSRTAKGDNPDILVEDGGRLTISNARLNNYLGSSLAAPVIRQTGGALKLANCAFERAATPNGTAPVVEQTGGWMTMHACSVTARAGGNQTFLSISTDHALNNISGNNFETWPTVVPTGVLLGNYGPNREGWKSFSPSLNFTTPGDFSATYTMQAGRYRHEAGGVRFEIRIEATTGAFTTAAGIATVDGLPVTSGGALEVGQPVGWHSGFTLGTGYTSLGASIAPGQNRFRLRRSGPSLGSIGPGNMTASTAVALAFTGFIPT